MSDDLVRLARTVDGRIVRETDLDAAFYVGIGTEADLTEAPAKVVKPAPEAKRKRSTTKPKGEG